MAGRRKRGDWSRKLRRREKGIEAETAAGEGGRELVLPPPSPPPESPVTTGSESGHAIGRSPVPDSEMRTLGSRSLSSGTSDSRPSTAQADSLCSGSCAPDSREDLLNAVRASRSLILPSPRISLERSRSLSLSNIHPDMMTPEQKLHNDMRVAAELAVRGVVSAETQEVFAAFLKQQCRTIYGEDWLDIPDEVRVPIAVLSPPTPAALRRRPREEEAEHQGNDSTNTSFKRTCLVRQVSTPGNPRDPRIYMKIRKLEAAFPAPEPLLPAGTSDLPRPNASQVTRQQNRPIGEAPGAAPPEPAPRAAPPTSESLTSKQQPISYADALLASKDVPATPTRVKETANQASMIRNETQVNTKSKTRFPPIIAEVFSNWAKHFAILRGKLGHAPNARPMGQGVRFIPGSERESRIIREYLSELEKTVNTDNLSWFVHADPNDTFRKVAIRGLPVCTSPEEIIAALALKGFKVKYARPINARKGRPGCIFFAILENTPNVVPDIYKITELMHMPGIHIEAWRKKKGVAQCHRCQAFRHSSLGCHRRMACVRCGEEHAARDCPRPLETAATCANCGGAHPANFAECPQFRRERRNRKAGIAALTKPPRRPTAARRNEPPGTSATIQADPGAANLMAPANPPTERGSNRRKRGKRKKKAKVEAIPPRPLITTVPYAPSRVSAAAPDAPVPKPRTTKTNSSAASSATPATMTLHRVIEILREVLTALKDGGDPVAVVVNALCSILNNAQLEQLESSLQAGSSAPPPPTNMNTSAEQVSRPLVA